MSKRFIAIVATVSILTSSFYSFGQKIKLDFNPDSVKKISLVEFNQRVDRAIIMLETRKLSQIPDTEHINIMMCLNTIMMTSSKELGALISVSPDSTLKVYATIKRFSNGRYQKLEDITEQKKYDEKILKVYPEWIWTVGMGYYFPKLKMEVYGLPDPRSWFDVSD